MKNVYWGIWILNIESLENRFNQNGLECYEALQQILILAASKKNYDKELEKILGSYNNERSHELKILELFLEFPVTNDQNEIFQNEVNWDPNHSTMSHERLNHCMIFLYHKEKVDELNLTNLATKFRRLWFISNIYI